MSATPLPIRRHRHRPSQQGLPDPMPGFQLFQLCKLVDRPPSGSEWLHEIKFDGYRMELRVYGGRAAWFTRHGHNWTDRFPELSAIAGELPNCILDGELCALGAEGWPNFSRLRSALAREDTDALVLFAFDILFEGDADLRNYSLETRKVRLRAMLKQGGEPVERALRYVDEFPGQGPLVFKAACEIGLEGIVSKRRGDPYRGGRGESWLKCKCRPGEEVVIGGWRTEGDRFRSLIAGVWEGERLRYVGRIHTGYSAKIVEDFMPKLRALETTVNPFTAGDLPRKTSDIHWVRPELVANVEFAEFSTAGKLRQASFKGLREDKTADELRGERESATP
jgi:bifunctional non-homologous end joining protein LigD